MTAMATEERTQIGSGAWLKERFPDKDWHQHARGQSGTQWCDGTPSDCTEKPRV